MENGVPLRPITLQPLPAAAKCKTPIAEGVVRTSKNMHTSLCRLSGVGACARRRRTNSNISLTSAIKLLFFRNAGTGGFFGGWCDVPRGHTKKSAAIAQLGRRLRGVEQSSKRHHQQSAARQRPRSRAEVRPQSDLGRPQHHQ